MVNHTSIGTISKATLGKLLRQGGAHKGFPSTWSDTILNRIYWYLALKLLYFVLQRLVLVPQLLVFRVELLYLNLQGCQILQKCENRHRHRHMIQTRTHTYTHFTHRTVQLLSLLTLSSLFTAAFAFDSDKHCTSMTQMRATLALYS